MVARNTRAGYVEKALGLGLGHNAALASCLGWVRGRI
jgi:hypothetical protein